MTQPVKDLFLLGCVIAGAFAACAAPQRFYTRTQILMGTVPVSITVRAPRGADPLAVYQAMADAYQTARHLEEKVRRLEERPRSAERRADLKLTPLLKQAAYYKNLSHGAFDIAYAGHSIALGGIAKGYIVDKMADSLRKKQIGSFMINAGGDLWAEAPALSEACTEPAECVEGDADQTGWAVGLQDPTKAPGNTLCSLQLKDAGMATSGTYERGDHIIDPKTRQPAASSWSSVSVIAPSATEADALATAGFVMGKKAEPFFQDLIDLGKPLQVILVDKAGKIRCIGTEDCCNRERAY